MLITLLRTFEICLLNVLLAGGHRKLCFLYWVSADDGSPGSDFDTIQSFRRCESSTSPAGNSLVAFGGRTPVNPMTGVYEQCHPGVAQKIQAPSVNRIADEGGCLVLF